MPKERSLAAVGNCTLGVEKNLPSQMGFSLTNHKKWALGFTKCPHHIRIRRMIFSGQSLVALHYARASSRVASDQLNPKSDRMTEPFGILTTAQGLPTGYKASRQASVAYQTVPAFLVSMRYVLQTERNSTRSIVIR